MSRVLRFGVFLALLLSLAALIEAARAMFNDTRAEPTDFVADLARLDAAIADLDKSAADRSQHAARRAQMVYRRAVLTGTPSGYTAASTAIAAAFRDSPPSPDLYLLKAQIDFTLHRIADAKRDLANVSPLDGDALALEGDIAVQEGRDDDARVAYAEALRKNAGWSILARQAFLKSLTDDTAAADALYAQAEDDVTAKEMRAYAWLELQRGLLWFRHGRPDLARTYYERASSAYSGYWLVDEHLAELAGAERHFEHAIALYEDVIARSSRPEAEEALGDLYQFVGDPARSATWHDRALTEYVRSAQRGEVHYFHHISAIYADAREDGSDALIWARKDFVLRQDTSARDALAWALYRDGQFAEAHGEIARALAPGRSDAHLFFHAAMIDLAAGDIVGGRQFLDRAAAVNPLFDTFHVHR